MATLEFVVAKRGVVRSQVTKIYNQLEANEQVNWSSTKKSTTINKLKNFEIEISKYDDEILLKKYGDQVDADAMEADGEENALYIDKVCEAIAILEEPTTNDQNNLDRGEHFKSFLKRPTAPLPLFNSLEGENLSQFLHNFETTIQPFRLSNYDKFLLLKQQVKGRASTLIDSLELNDTSYEKAKDLLVSALATPDLQKFNVLKQLSEIRLTQNMDPFQYISKVKNVVQSFDLLQIGIKDVLQYFVWNGLNEGFQTQIVNIVNKSRPNLDEILGNFFDASDRYLHAKRSKEKSIHAKPNENSSSNASNFALGVSFEPKVDTPIASDTNNKFKPCVLCDSERADHPLFKCLRFPDSISKVEKLKSLGCCCSCGYPGHLARECRFRFRNKCFNCKQWHFTFLCPKPNNDSVKLASNSEKGGVSGASKPEVVKTQPKKVFFKGSKPKEVTNASLWDNGSIVSILPTFTFCINHVPIRSFKDSGSQSSFILTDVATDLNLNVVKTDVDLTLNGFNSSKTLNTFSVSVPLNLQGKVVEVEAICVPNINVKLNLPGLKKVVSSFKEKGYVLADKFFEKDHEDSISEIQFILGADTSPCFPTSSVLFGSDDLNAGLKSEYFSSPTGVVLTGRIDKILENIEFLPPCNEDHQIGRVQSAIYSNSTLEFARQINLKETLDKVQIETICNFIALDNDGNLLEDEVRRASQEMMFLENNYYENPFKSSEETDQLNDELVEYVLNNTIVEPDGHLQMPLMWNGAALPFLGKNKGLAEKILHSNFRKLKNKPEALSNVDNYVREQVELGFIEKIENLPDYLNENPNHSFLAHMAIFKPEKESTKTRVVFLSNLCDRSESNPNALSHNQVIRSGPCLNSKLTSALLYSRFDKFFLCYDIKKAFLNIALSERDQSKLLFYWYRNIAKGDFELVAYRNKRLPFGLRCSPAILMLAMYYILILQPSDNIELEKFKRICYHLLYMDNGGFSTNNPEELREAFSNLKNIFQPYHFNLQQFATNDQSLQKDIDYEFDQSTSNVVKLLGLNWNRQEDTLFSAPLNLTLEANTKRQVLKSVASNFDPLNIGAPLLNRARLFLHTLQCDQNLTWDEKISGSRKNEWNNICKQLNNSPPLVIPRCVGNRDSDFTLIAFTDASRKILGTVIYIQCNITKNISFLMVKNKLVGKSLESKSIPSLELGAIDLGVETLTDLYFELTNPSLVISTQISQVILYSDSLVCLNWINSYVRKLDKMQKVNVYVRNRLRNISLLCEKTPMTFKFVPGNNNPADYVTREVSYKQLIATCYLSGPKFLSDSSCFNEDVLSVTVPHLPKSEKITYCNLITNTENLVVTDIISHYSDFGKMSRVYFNVLKFINLLKGNYKKRHPHSQFVVEDSDDKLHKRALNDLVRCNQRKHFKEIFEFFDKEPKAKKLVPNSVAQMNIYPDETGTLRVGGKFKGVKDKESHQPILLPKDGTLTLKLIDHFHHKLSHAGCYTVLAEMKKQFWIPQYYSVVKKRLRQCVTCKRFNNRTVSLNQSPYREFRFGPDEVPFGNVFLDYLGPYNVKINNKTEKVYILIITCLWSRSINLKITSDLTVKNFLRALQLHIFEFGLPKLCISDSGSQLVAGANIVKDFLNNADTHKFFLDNDIKRFEFDHYFKGCNELGSLVEIGVKMVKRLIFGSLRNLILDYPDFEFIVLQTVHIVNKRPIAFKEGLRDVLTDSVPDPITPEILVKGRNLNSINIIPDLQTFPDAADPDWEVNPRKQISDNYEKLKQVRERLISVYHTEFLSTLISQAIDRKGRYKPNLHNKINPGDIILLRDPLTKPIHFPMALVKDVQINTLGEVTGVTAYKGKSGELVKRHVKSIVPLLTRKMDTQEDITEGCKNKSPIVLDTKCSTRPKRQAAKIAQSNWRHQIEVGDEY